MEQHLDLRSLRQLVRQGEGEQLEFKLKTNHPDKIVREVVAFANTAGGMLLVGVSDDRQIKGLNRADEDMYLLEMAIERYCYPSITYRFEKIAVQHGLDVLVCHVPKSPLAPHFVEDTDGGRRVYFRVGEKSIQASSELQEILRYAGHTGDIGFTYGEAEHRLMQLLDQHKMVTVESFAADAGISRKRAAEILVLMVLTKIVRIHPDDVEDKFSMILPEQQAI